MSLQVAVIGGGIGGLSAALAMLKAGCDVHVYEAAFGAPYYHFHRGDLAALRSSYRRRPVSRRNFRALFFSGSRPSPG